jgi:hypothetical protein
MEEYKKALVNHSFQPLVIEGADHWFLDKQHQERIDKVILKIFCGMKDSTDHQDI